MFYTENGWPSCGPDDLDRSPIPGTDVALPLQRGLPSLVLKAFAADLNEYVESVYNSRGGTDEGGWTPTNSVATSNHLGGTAFDYNWSDHPMGNEYAGWNWSEIIGGNEVPAVRELLDYYEGNVFWGNDWTSPKDSMHFQMGYGTYEDQDRVRDFVSRKIRADGFSRFRRGDSTGPDPAQVLSDVMGGSVSLDRYRQLMPAVTECLRDCGCTTLPRLAMWCAQIGHESVGLKYMEEIASGAAYEGRVDLGNTQPGDGVRFKGRGPIQVTGRHNYTVLSQWAFDKGLVPSPGYFVDHPEELASDRYGFVGVTWYWTTQRRLNEASDAKDLETATRYINGGLNGIDDRRTRYNRAVSMGDQLLALLDEQDDFMAALSADEQRELLDLARQQAKYRRPSLSPLRHLGEGNVNTCAGFAWTADALTHPQFVLMAAKLGHVDSIQLLGELAAADLTLYPDREADAKLAEAMLKEVERTNPDALQNYLKGKA